MPPLEAVRQLGAEVALSEPIRTAMFTAWRMPSCAGRTRTSLQVPRTLKRRSLGIPSFREMVNVKLLELL